MLTSLSDYPGYTDLCRQAAEDTVCFESIRRHPTYRAVVTPELHHSGEDYWALLRERGFPTGFFDEIRDLDRLGGPDLRIYEGAGAVAPETMRYVKTLSDLERLFGSLDGASIAEIGVGYGGLCAVIARRYRIARYTLLDLDGPLMLAERYLGALGVEGVVFQPLAGLRFDSRFDLAISCYALSEIARPMQVQYIQRVLLRARQGYLMWNNEAMKAQRDWQLAHFGDEMLYADDMLALVPGAETLDAGWITAEDCASLTRMIVWGHRAP